MRCIGFEFRQTTGHGFGVRRGVHPYGNALAQSSQSARQPHRWRPEHAAAPSPPRVSQMVWRAARGNARVDKNRGSDVLNIFGDKYDSSQRIYYLISY